MGIKLLVLELALLWQLRACAANTLDIFHTGCFSESLSSGQSSATSFIDCVAGGRTCGPASGLTVSQWNDRENTCRQFSYQKVCQQLRSAGRQDQASPTSCRTVIGTKYDAIAASRLFSYFFVGDAGTDRMENLACVAVDPEPSMLSAGVSWTGEGPRLDGTNSSRLWSTPLPDMNRDTILTFSLLIRLKRKPRYQCLVEVVDCDTFKLMGMQFLEWNCLAPDSNPNGAVFTNMGPFGRAYLNESTLTNDENQFFTLTFGVTRLHILSPVNYNYYRDFSVVPHGELNYTHWLTNTSYCMTVGWGSSNDNLTQSINGVVAAVGLSSNKLYEVDLRQVFKFIY